MNILIIAANNEKEPYPVAPIGVAYIAKALMNAGHTVKILDLCFVKDDFDALGTCLKRFSPDIVGISIRNIDNLTYNRSICYLPRIRKIVAFLKDNTSAYTVVGGSGFSLFPESVLRYLDLETGIVGQGEVAFPEFIEAFGAGRDFSNIQNLCTVKGGTVRLNKIQHNNFVCEPDRSFLNNSVYLELGGMANIQSKRGCPFECTYCTYPNIEGNQLRLRSAEDTVEELKAMQNEYGIDHVFFVDDIFNFPEEHAVGICEGIIRNELKISWTCFATPKGMSKELAVLMKRAGCMGVEFGSDAGSEATLKGFGKRFSIDDIAYATEYCKEVSLPVAHYVIVCGPDENESTLGETLSLFDKIEPSAVIALIGVRIYPQTRLYKRALENRVIKEEDNLLEPVFYLSPHIDADILLHKVSEHARGRHNWIVPGLNIRCEHDMLAALRSMGKRGALWDMLSFSS